MGDFLQYGSNKSRLSKVNSPPMYYGLSEEDQLKVIESMLITSLHCLTFCMKLWRPSEG